MQYSKLLSKLLLLLMIPSIVIYPQAEVPSITFQAPPESIEIETTRMLVQNEQLFSYDDVVNFIEQLEKGELENRCGLEDLERINHFLVLLAREGILPNDANEELALELDIQELLHEDDNPYEHLFSFDLGGEYSIVPAVFYGRRDVILCNWIKKKIDKITKFITKHKTAILVGVAVVVAVAVAACAIAAISAVEATTAAVGGAAGAAASSGREEKNQSTPNDEGVSTPPEAPADISPSLIAANEAPNLRAAFDEHISSFKEMVVEDNLLQTSDHSKNLEDNSLGKQVRDLGAFLAHEALEGVSQLAFVVPKLQEEIAEIADRILPDCMLPKNNLPYSNSVEDYENMIAAGHQKIDQVFSTNQADYYNLEAKAVDHFAIGIIPLPGALSVCSLEMNTGRIAATQATTIRGWTAGQPITNLTKSGNVPKWTTVRSRYWKNRAEWAKSNPHKYGDENIPRMENGLAPQKFNSKTGQLESMELHHNPAQKDGGLFDFIEVWPDEHAKLDSCRYLGR